jgi:hypothetical protein
MGLPTVREKFRRELARVKPVKFPGSDTPPADIAKLLGLAQLLAKQGTDTFARREARVAMAASPGPGTTAIAGSATRRRWVATTFV